MYQFRVGPGLLAVTWTLLQGALQLDQMAATTALTSTERTLGIDIDAQAAKVAREEVVGIRTADGNVAQRVVDSEPLVPALGKFVDFKV